MWKKTPSSVDSWTVKFNNYLKVKFWSHLYMATFAMLHNYTCRQDVVRLLQLIWEVLLNSSFQPFYEFKLLSWCKQMHYMNAKKKILKWKALFLYQKDNSAVWTKAPLVTEDGDVGGKTELSSSSFLDLADTKSPPCLAAAKVTSPGSCTFCDAPQLLDPIAGFLNIIKSKGISQQTANTEWKAITEDIN